MIKNTFWLVFLYLSLSLPALSQVAMLEKAYTHLKANELDKSLEAIEHAVAHETTRKDPKTWYLKAYILKELYRTYPDSAAYREKALQAVDQCISLDNNQTFREDCAAIASFIYTSYLNDAIQHLNTEAYAKAISMLKPLITDSTDTYYTEALYYNAYAHLMSGKAAQAYPMFEKVLRMGYQDPLAYEQVAQFYMEKGALEQAAEVLQQGNSAFPANERLQIATLNNYMAAQQYKAAETVAENYLSDHPEDIEVMLVAGTIYEKLFQADTAHRETYFLKRKNIYLSALKRSPDNAIANYNLGITLYNQAVNIINTTDVYSMDIMEFDRLLGNCTTLFKEALPYIQKAHDLAPNNINTLKALEGIYYNLNDKERIALVRKRIKTLE